MNKLMYFTNKELFLQIVLNISKTKAFRYVAWILAISIVLSIVYGFITVMEYVTNFVNYVVWGIN